MVKTLARLALAKKAYDWYTSHKNGKKNEQNNKRYGSNKPYSPYWD